MSSDLESAAPAAQAGTGLGIDWSVLLVVLASILALMFVIRLVGLWAAARRPVPAAVIPGATRKPNRKLFAVITAAVAACLDKDAAEIQILDVKTVRGGNISAQQAWSMEGRREIYRSHRVR